MPADKPQSTILILSQVYVPDPAAVGQCMADAAAEMARRGWRVVVFTASRGYDDASIKYKRREVRDGVEIRRMPFSSFGKHSIKLRLLAGMFFMCQCVLHAIWTRRLSAVLVSTSPPMCAVAAVIISALRRVPVKYWVMDLNPDQMIAVGKITERSLPARLFDFINRAILRRAVDVVALDHFMADRLLKKHDVRNKLQILPPWPHDDHLEVVAHADNPFRREHGLEGKFVIMYSGNHGLTTPVTTVLEAALRLQDVEELVFMFIGSGHGKKDVERVIAEHHPTNIRSLPYQPLSQIKYSLSAADVHLVTMVDEVVGVIHPCKIYGAMSVERPILMIGPEPSHVTDILEEWQIGWRVPHGDVDAAVEVIRKILATDPHELAEMGGRAGRAARSKFSKEHLASQFGDVLERGFRTSTADEVVP